MRTETEIRHKIAENKRNMEKYQKEDKNHLVVMFRTKNHALQWVLGE